MRISDWSSDVCSSDIGVEKAHRPRACHPAIGDQPGEGFPRADFPRPGHRGKARFERRRRDDATQAADRLPEGFLDRRIEDQDRADAVARSEAHTSELQSLMRHSYAVFCLKKK